MFIDGHERLDMVENQNNFLTRIEDLKPYIVKFKKYVAIKPKIYLSDCILRGDDC